MTRLRQNLFQHAIPLVPNPGIRPARAPEHLPYSGHSRWLCMDIDLQLNRAIINCIQNSTSCLPALPNETRPDLYIQCYTQLFPPSSLRFPTFCCITLCGSLPFQALLSRENTQAMLITSSLPDSRSALPIKILPIYPPYLKPFNRIMTLLNGTTNADLADLAETHFCCLCFYLCLILLTGIYLISLDIARVLAS